MGTSTVQEGIELCPIPPLDVLDADARLAKHASQCISGPGRQLSKNGRQLPGFPGQPRKVAVVRGMVTWF